MIMREAITEDLQEGTRIGHKNVNNLRYVDDTTLISEIADGLKDLVESVKRVSESAGLHQN